MTWKSLLVLPLLLLAGCSAAYWGGEASGSSPGVHFRGPNFWHAAEFSVTSDANAAAKKMEFTMVPATQPGLSSGMTLNIEDATFGQNATTVTLAQPEKIRAIGEMQMSQVAYLKELMTGISDIVGQVMPLFNVLAAARIQSTDTGLSLTLPNGLSIGGHKVTTPGDLAEIIRAANGALSNFAESVESRPGP